MTMAALWLDKGERGSILLLRLMMFLARLLGRNAAALLLYPISAYFFLTSAEARRASREFLGRARGRRASSRDVFSHIHCFATTILDRVLLFSGEGAAVGIDVHDADGLLERVRRGEGCLLIGSHLGSFDMLRAFTVQRTDIRLKILMDAAHSPKLTGVLAALAPDIAATLQPMRGPGDLLRLREWIGDGYLIALLGDRAVPGEEGIEADFLGIPAKFPSSPLKLAATLRAPVYTFFGLYRGNGRYSAHFDLLAEQVELPREERARALEMWVQHYADHLAAYARSAPENWFNFYPFWRA